MSRSGSLQDTDSKSKLAQMMSDIVSSPKFENLAGLLIIASAVAVGVEVQYAADSSNTRFPTSFFLAQVFFCTWFGAELLLRFAAEGCRFLYGPERMWNWFDIIIVGSAIAEVILTSNLEGHPLLLFARMIRIVRIIRIIRVVNWLKELKQMCYAIFLTFKSLVWSLVLMALIMYSCSICLTSAVTQHLMQQAVLAGLSKGELLQQAEDEHYLKTLGLNFGTVPRTVYTLFKSFTGGENWGPKMDTLYEVHWVFCALFLFFIGFTVFAFLNIITGFFCENAMDMASRDKELVVMQ